MTTLTVYPYGPDVQSHYEQLRSEGATDGEASAASSSIEVEWPDELRLPVTGDSLLVGWAHGYVTSVHIGEEDGEWHVILHLGRERFLS